MNDYRRISKIKAFIEPYVKKTYKDMDSYKEDVIVGVLDFIEEEKRLKNGKQGKDRRL